MSEGVGEVKTIYVIWGDSDVDYEPGYEWLVAAYQDKEHAQKAIDRLNTASSEIDKTFDRYSSDKIKEMLKIDPRCSGWGDDKPEYSIVEIELL